MIWSNFCKTSANSFKCSIVLLYVWDWNIAQVSLCLIFLEELKVDNISVGWCAKSSNIWALLNSPRYSNRLPTPENSFKAFLIIVLEIL